jgi:hypothetical protein
VRFAAVTGRGSILLEGGGSLGTGATPSPVLGFSLTRDRANSLAGWMGGGSAGTGATPSPVLGLSLTRDRAPY